jgi:hypothetical protein
MKTRISLIIFSILVLFSFLACSTTQNVINTVATSVPVNPPTPVSGWSEFKSENIAIWLPDSFEGGDLKNDLEVIISNLKSLGPDYEQIAKMIEANPSVFLIWAYDSKIGSSGFLTNVNITHEQVVSAVTLDMYADAVRQQLTSDFTITSQNNVKLGQNDALQLLIELNRPGMTAKQVMYAIKDNNTIYCITYTTGSDEYEERLPDFEQSASSFTITP